MYAIDRLTAPQPTWETAVIFARGVQPFVLTPEDVEIRKTKDNDGNEILILKEEGTPDPWKQQENNMEFNHVSDKEIHFYVAEIVRVEFYSNARKVKLTAPGPATSAILTETGEKQPQVGKENPLKKA